MRMNVKVYLMLAIALLVLGGTALAQDKAPKIEVFGGFSYFRTAGSSNVNGWNAQAAFNVKKWIGIASDFAGHYQTISNDLKKTPALPLLCSGRSFRTGPGK